MSKTYLEAKNRDPVKLDSVESPTIYPYTLTPTFSELVVDRNVLVHGSTSMGIYVKLGPNTKAKFKVLGSHNGTDYYALPIVGFNSGDSVVLKPHIMEFNSTADDQNYVFSIPISDIIRYASLRVSGSGTIDNVEVSIK